MTISIPKVESLRRHSERALASRVAAEAAERVRSRELLRKDISKFVEEQLSTLVIDMASAADSGRCQCSRSWDSSHVPEGAAHAVAARLRAEGYEASCSRSEEDYGDSAAPCRVDLITLEVSW